MNKQIFAIGLAMFFINTIHAQPTQQRVPNPVIEKQEEKKSSAVDLVFNPDHTITTNHTVTIKGKPIPYKAVTGTLPVWDENGKAIAGLFFVYYERTDIKDKANRPLTVSFNGGPGSASVWMHIGYTGPVLLNIDDEGYPVQPYGYTQNPESILDATDIVYVDPVNTGYSRIVGNAPKDKFFGINADVKYLGDWVNSFVTRYDRWASPKFLIGESYGTVRVSGLALELQQSHWMYLNGVVLVSPTDLGIERGTATGAALWLPYYAATAWYHKKLPQDLQQKSLTAMLPEVEQFTMNELIPALNKGSLLTDADKQKLASRMARFSGLPEKVILQNNLSISTNLYWKELLRNEGFTVGRLDSRYKGIDKRDGGERPDFNAELTAWLHSFTPPINMYIRNELNYKTDITYNMFGNVYPWDNENNRTGESLRQAMATNPFLHVLVQSGYYDGACDYFNAKYNMWQMDPSGKLKSRMSWEGYESGHMMYLRKVDLKMSNEHLREFIRKAIPKAGTPAMY
ncbi:MAG TPA: carboxypeptidase [Niabella sp.]|nr:carboxypeptidase [Niabella sp.]HOZ96822.1 carboxypeptidase [Niabella sp.]HQW14701.1 carboxypeptidase [Niabella sp.]HQX20047.1 carboxypeptidase [Niabella sp.]HQX42347.1 carboxypeptidase [Niabella sp.]